MFLLVVIRIAHLILELSFVYDSHKHLWTGDKARMPMKHCIGMGDKYRIPYGEHWSHGNKYNSGLYSIKWKDIVNAVCKKAIL